MTAPLVSVILPVYNRAHSLGPAVDSVLAQTCRDLELLVVDDGSTDGTGALLAAYSDPRLRVLHHADNRGAAAARNTGIAAARGRWLAFLDSDDTWAPDKLTRQLADLAAQQPSHLVGCTGYRVLTATDTWDALPAPVTRERLLLECDLSPGSTLLAGREVFEAVGPFDETWPRYEDWDWLLRCEARYAIRVLPAVLAHVHYSPVRPTAAVETGAAAFLNRYGEELRGRGRFGRKALGRRWLELARYQALARRPRPFLAYLGRALITWPWISPGSLLLLIDAWCGTRMTVRARRVKAWLGARGAGG